MSLLKLFLFFQRHYLFFDNNNITITAKRQYETYRSSGGYINKLGTVVFTIMAEKRLLVSFR